MLPFLHRYGPSLAVVLAILVGVLMMGRSARRFIAEQQRLGRWDKNGPLHPTTGPPHRNVGGGMDERLEVTGQWTPEPPEEELEQDGGSL